ncbi:MAG: ABC transporter permease [Eggerthellaceae bacterium]|nr:ABC transporter permease [Eggerthellaceae bacterium]
MDLIKSIFATYPDGVDLQLSDFTYSLSTANPYFGITLATLLITFILGFLVYVYSFILVVREKSAPYPLWMHTFYCAADFMGIWVFLAANEAVGGFWFFVLGAVGEVVWVGFEIFCLYHAVTTERVALFGKDGTLKHAILVTLAEIAIFFVSLNFLRVELGDVSMFKFWIFTQVIIVCAPGLFWRERGTRLGACWQLVVVLVLVAIMSFNPLGNMWSLISPYFAPAVNPWYYVMGAVVFCFAIYDVVVYAKLPKKPEVLPSGKKPIF